MFRCKDLVLTLKQMNFNVNANVNFLKTGKVNVNANVNTGGKIQTAALSFFFPAKLFRRVVCYAQPAQHCFFKERGIQNLDSMAFYKNALKIEMVANFMEKL